MRRFRKLRSAKCDLRFRTTEASIQLRGQLSRYDLKNESKPTRVRLMRGKAELLLPMVVVGGGLLREWIGPLIFVAGNSKSAKANGE